MVFLALTASVYAQAQPGESPWRAAPVWPTHLEYRSQDAEKPVSPAPDPGFTIQVGAFRDRATAMSKAATLGSASVKVERTLRNGESWYLVLLGAYATKVEALAGEGLYLSANPGADTWVRTMPESLAR
ncbi:SPOR domain-containing protein [Candidatus Litorirhabdus singularis]|nr:SPOR domain-containing protein [Candidatus Litorirhabdus singularis]